MRDARGELRRGENPQEPPRRGKLDPERKSVVICFNRSSGSRDREATIRTLQASLEQAGMTVLVPDTLSGFFSEVKDLRERGSLRAVVAAGGDGTVSLLANELGRDVPIALFPLGTENLLAKHLGVTADVAEVTRTLEMGRTTRLDVGRANGTCFLVMASCGFDADVVHRLHRRRSGHIQHWSYAGPILGAMFGYGFPRIRLTVDGEPMPGRWVKWAFVFNAPRYAMNLPLVEDASPLDGELDLCTFRGGNFVTGLFYLITVFFRRHRRWGQSEVRRLRRLRLESDRPVPYQLDGDPGGHLPLDIGIEPAFLEVLIPPRGGKADGSGAAKT